jgi:2-O-(6-phospho-alpha-D-mannosyl)-D-glycerate hydrolase
MVEIRSAHILSHTHWDREWYLNSPYTNAWLVPFFDSLFKMLEKEPRYRFILDGQTCLVEDWCEQLQTRGEDAAPFREKLAGYVRARRVLVGPYYLQPDWQLVSEEALVRNLLLGRKMSRELGGGMQVGWLLDNFGQISQAPQIHREFGLNGLFVWRGAEMTPTGIRSEFEWGSPDGSSVTAVYLVGSYRNGMRLAEYRDCMRGRVQREVAKLQPFATTPNVLLMNGYDQEIEPDDVLPPLERGELNFDEFDVVQSTPEEYLAALERANPLLPRINGGLYSGRYIAVFPGALSSRMYLKTSNDACQRKLERVAEPLATLLWSLGQDYPTARLRQAWKLLLKNHPHDSICGVSIDDVHSDMEARLAESSAAAEGVIDHTLIALAANIDTRRDPASQRSWVVVNPTLQKRSGIIALPGDSSDLIMQDSIGRSLETQRTNKATIVRVADIPALGYQTLFAMPAPLTKRASRGDYPTAAIIVYPDVRVIENEFARVLINADGAITLTDKGTQTTYANMGIFEDGGDAGDTYNYSGPEFDQILTSRGHAVAIDFVETGPLRGCVKISSTLRVPAALASDGKHRSEDTCTLTIVSWLTIEAHSPLIQFHTEIHNNARDHRLRVLFPTNLRAEHSHAETQFDVVSRPITPEPYEDSTIPDFVRDVLIGAREPNPITTFPQRRFVDVSDGTRGLAILNRGLPEYEILPDKNTIALTLFRSIGWIAKSDLKTRVGDAGPMIAVPDAQCLRTLAYDYAIFVHPGDWKTASLLGCAEKYSSELLVVETGAHPGVLPASAGWLELLTNDTLSMTAVKQAEDGAGIIVRFFNPSYASATGTIHTAFKITRASYATLSEDFKDEIPVSDPHSLLVSAKPKQIVTIRLELERATTPFSSASPGTERIAIQESSDFGKSETEMAFLTEALALEDNRAKVLEKAWEEKRRALLSSVETTNLLESSQQQLDVETRGRAALEARLSAALLEKKLLQLGPASALSENRLRELESDLREIGAALNAARTRKRAFEYITDYYANTPPSSIPLTTKATHR